MTTEPTPLPPSPSVPAPYPAAAPAPARETSALAITALVCGVLGWTLAPLVASLVAVVTGHMARAQIRASEGRLDGDGMAVAGLVLGWISVGIAIAAVVALILIIVFFGGLAAFLAASQG